MCFFLRKNNLKLDSASKDARYSMWSVIPFVEFGLKPWVTLLQDVDHSQMSTGLHLSHLKDSWLFFFSKGYLSLGLGCVLQWLYLSSVWHMVWLSMAEFPCKKVQDVWRGMTVWRGCVIPWVCKDVSYQNDWIWIKLVSKICIFSGAQKQTRELFVLAFSPCLNSHKQNIQGTHNYAVAGKKKKLFSPKQMEREY